MMNEKPNIPKLPNLAPQTRIIFQGDNDFKQHAYQYGTTSHADGSMAPAVIIYPKTLKDVQAVVKYAHENGLGIAVRTGGHQYSGMYICNF